MVGLDPTIHYYMSRYWVYILTNKPYGTLYIGVTRLPEQRMTTHKQSLVKGFSSKYKLHMLVYYEEFDNIHQAIQREKSLKRWYRDWKIDLINAFNPEWEDLAANIAMDPRVKPEDDKAGTL